MHPSTMAGFRDEVSKISNALVHVPKKGMSLGKKLAIGALGAGALAGGAYGVKKLHDRKKNAKE